MFLNTLLGRRSRVLMWHKEMCKKVRERKPETHALCCRVSNISNEQEAQEGASIASRCVQVWAFAFEVLQVRVKDGAYQCTAETRIYRLIANGFSLCASL